MSRAGDFARGKRATPSKFKSYGPRSQNESFMRSGEFELKFNESSLACRRTRSPNKQVGAARDREIQETKPPDTPDASTQGEVLEREIKKSKNNSRTVAEVGRWTRKKRASTYQ